MSKILSILDPLPEVSARDYTWSDVYGDDTVRDHAAARDRVGPVKVIDIDRTVSNVFCTYGSLPEEHEALEALLFTDGTIVAVVTVSSWNGTFDPDRRVRINMYLLTPKIAPVRTKRSTRGRK